MNAKHVVEQEKGTKRENIRMAIAFLKETDGLLKIEDILPFFPDFALIDDFKYENEVLYLFFDMMGMGFCLDMAAFLVGQELYCDEVQNFQGANSKLRSISFSKKDPERQQIFSGVLFGWNINQTDHFALLQFKQLISSDPYGILDSWNSSTHFCKWNGIMCSPKHQRVTTLMLQGYNLHGSISPYIGNISHMRFLNLGNNSFNGSIPQELSRLSRLRFFLLLNNSLDGEFPLNLTKCSELKVIHISGNKLIGSIPSQIGSLQKLQNFIIERNNFSGKIPPSVRNLSSLILFGTGYNNLTGNLPQELCYLKQLKRLSLHANKLSGTLPSCLYNMSSLTFISAAANNFTGFLPSNMFHTLHNLQYFAIGWNQFSEYLRLGILECFF
ncbi:LRR receptor-like serine/threonine-protein kinase EFR [Vicia villosa]|uniref:LRR receptor-like serine/threonine-protein kinase EFR n=1 Tax=Vicia villosa TaxID=3911 RepID=UPI00273C69FE|nr:LRR receptor-like serine/threonine-protein kinase EFR [Vicia villosa]